MKTENQPSTLQVTTMSGSKTVRIELRVNGRLFAGVTTSQIPGDAFEAMAVLEAAITDDSPTVPDSEMI